jgi:peptidoglycan/xylan/chitin deacetylase (PgdA/CDA1 family)
MPHTLMYHDIVSGGKSARDTGFSGPSADLYKLDSTQFQQHLDAIATRRSVAPIDVLRLPDSSPGSWLLTFDDGGISAFEETVPQLQERGWIGHFFVTTSRIGQPGFLDKNQIQEIRRLGHIVGSHSHSHPVRISHCNDGTLADEWVRSCAILEDLLGEPVTVASVPGGFDSPRVARWAAAAGIKVLFNSEPCSRLRVESGCCIVGRYTIRNRSSALEAAGLAAGEFLPTTRQKIQWNLKKIAKTLGGSAYLHVREYLLKSTPPN